LHAAELEFAHPITGEPLSFESPLPDDLVQLIAALARDRVSADESSK
jgi:23S rRNA pseudouridine1911/1915/1917 synthase